MKLLHPNTPRQYDCGHIAPLSSTENDGITRCFPITDDNDNQASMMKTDDQTQLQTFTAGTDNRSRPVTRRDHRWLLAIALSGWVATYLLVPLL